MEQQKLPNATISLILGIISFIACCFSWGIGGVLLSGIALFLTKKDKNTYDENPDNYDNYGQVKTAKIIALIGLILAVLYLIMVIVLLITFGGLQGLQEWQEEQLRNAGM